jgi:hypothetical protein
MEVMIMVSTVYTLGFNSAALLTNSICAIPCDVTQTPVPATPLHMKI